MNAAKRVLFEHRKTHSLAVETRFAFCFLYLLDDKLSEKSHSTF
jgi:hypothetical protein